MDPYWQDHWLTVYGGDCRAVLRELPAESVHCVITSPPYWGLRNYGIDSQIGLEQTPDEYVAAMVDAFREVRRVLRSDGTVWLNLGDSYASGEVGRHDRGRPEQGHGWAEYDYGQNGRQQTRLRTGLKPKDLVGIPWRVAFALQSDGWYLRSDMIWAKPNPMPESVTDRPTKAHEYVFLLAKSARYFFDADAVREASDYPELAGKPQKVSYHDASAMRNDGNRVAIRTAGRNLRSVWNIATAPYPGAHFATFPPKLVEPCVKAGCPEGGTVLDPFAGTGTVGVVAQSLSRRAVLIDLNPEYLRQCLDRNRNVPLGL